MSWAKRGRQRFYYKAVWIDGKAKKVYLGSGPEAEQAAAEVERRRQSRARARAERAAQARRHERHLRPFLLLCAATDGLAHGALVAAG